MHGYSPQTIDDWINETEEDNARRIFQLKTDIGKKSILDFGCGAGGFLLKAESLATQIVGVEPEQRVVNHWKGRLKILPSLQNVQKKFNIITAFHVVEHLLDPIATLKKLSQYLLPHGRIIIEVPNSNDSLLSFYNCDAFKKFTYWSHHLFLFNSRTLKILAEKSGLKVMAIRPIQRYPLSNHLHWLIKGKPGGHKKWPFLDLPGLNKVYAKILAIFGKTDTIMAYLQK